jgi:hypothetical protein
MALLRNGALLYPNNNRYLSATGQYGLLRTLDGGAAKRNWGRGWQSVTDVTDKSGLPNGYRHPVAWMLPQKAGAITSRNEAYVTVSGTAAGALGKNSPATATVTISGLAVGGLIAGGVASATLTITGTADIFAGLGTTALATITLDGSATPAATGHLDAAGVLTVNGVVVPYAVGFMEATTDFGNELSPSALANAVWQRVIEAGFSAESVLRLIAAHAAGAATGLEGANPQFTGLDGSTLRIDGTYSAGTRTIDALDGS